MVDAAARRVDWARRPYRVLALAAVALMLPSLVWGTLPSHSSLHNLTWAAQFSTQVLHGIVYPRWLPDSFDGLGAPTFYFQPPLAFWIDALVSGLTLDLLSTSRRLAVTTTVLLGASGFAMYAWLRLHLVLRATALIGALAYMAAPYHLVDHYLRGALAEMAAYALLPVVMAGVTLVRRRHPAGEIVLALSYAALLMAHLPTALLASLTAIPAYVLLVAWDDRFFLARCGLAFALALALAAPFLWPAFSLQDAVQLDWISRYGFQVDRTLLTVIVASAAGWLLASLTLPVRRGPPLLWALVSLAALLLMSGLLPWLWALPLLSKVQFPWQLLMIVEFATITALCLAPWRRLARLLVLAAAALVAATTVTVAGVVDRVELASKGEAPAQEARDYLPAGFPQRAGTDNVNLELEAVAKQPLIACSPAARTCRAEPDRFGALRIELEGDRPITVTLRRFDFPAWQLTPPLPMSTSDPWRLVSFATPAGRHELRLDRQILPAERWGWIASALSSIALALTGLAKRWSTKS